VRPIFLIVPFSSRANSFPSLSEIIAKVIDIKDTTKVQILTGHTRSIREASWSPDGQLVVRSLYFPPLRLSKQILTSLSAGYFVSRRYHPYLAT
jgi:WD40 repeat protein